MAARSENNPTTLVDKFILAGLTANFMKSVTAVTGKKLKLHAQDIRSGGKAISGFRFEKGILHAIDVKLFFKIFSVIIRISRIRIGREE